MKIEQVVEDFRDEFDVPVPLRHHEIVALLRRLEPRLQIEKRELPGDTLARTVWVTSTFSESFGWMALEITPDTFEGLLENKGRSLFTVAHEIGHLVLHRADIVRGRAARCFADRRHPRFCDSEWQANAFAAALLAPYRTIRDRGLLRVHEIAEVCGVSLECADLRLRAITPRRMAFEQAFPQ